MDDLTRQIKIFEFLSSFNNDTKLLVERLASRYRDKPKEPADIVFNTVATLCLRIIISATPPKAWGVIMLSITKAIAKELKKEDK